MPAFGFTMESISAGSTGKVLQQGQLESLNTDGIAEGTVLYVGTSGNWSTTKPTGTALIQNIGKVLRDNISAGIIHVGGSGRTNDVPNIADGKIWIGNSSAVATPVTPSGDVTISNAGVTAIGSGVIVNDDINSSAAIAHSKLANLTDGNVLVGNSSNVPTGVAISGDVTLANTGATTVTDLTISGEAQGDILYFNGSNWVRLAAGTSGDFLKTQGSGANPTWASIPDSKILLGADSTETTVTGTTATQVKDLDFVKNSAGYNGSTITVVAAIKTDNAATTAHLIVEKNGGPTDELDLTTTSTSYEVVSGTIDISGLSAGVHTLEFYLYDGSGDTASLKQLEVYGS